MASLRTTMGCLAIDTSGSVSVLGGFFGFIRKRVPPDPDTTVTAAVSVLGQIRAVKQRHIHVNVIQVGFDAISGDTAQDEARQKLDYTLYRMRKIYSQASLGVGRVEHYFIDSADAQGADDLGSEDEADDLIAAWSVPNDAVDAFVVRNISDSDFVGKAADIPGECDKESKDDGVVAGEIGRGFEGFARTFAHEIGHHLGLSHNHGSNDCPDTTSGCNNLMAQSGCANSCGSGLRAATTLTSSQGETMRGHCAVRQAC